MSFTKVAPAGIGTSPGNSILIGDSLLHSTGIDIGSNTGIGVTIRKHGDATFTGIITASAFFGDGSGLEGVSSSGIGTPLSDDDTSQLNKVYYVNQELSIGSTVTVNHPDSAIASYTHYQDLVVKDNADFIVTDGDTFIPDVLGINTASLPNPVSGATGGRIRAGTITNAGANGAPNFPNGLTGTAGTFSGAITAASGTITGNLGVGGVLTYEDVTNIDSVGVITARNGINVSGGNINVGSGVTINSGGINIVGVITATTFSGIDLGNVTGAQGDFSIADKIVHTGDTNTALRFPSADTITAETAGGERIRIDSNGTITNTTTSSHSQGAGTFNIKGIINQYSQGSGSGLIFDCDFGRLTGYADNASIANSTDLSTALLHSTTDWVSSSSNTPMTVNGGSFNYRVGRGGYLDCVQNEGRVSVAAGSGSPNMAETLNTASMTIESWIWYDGAGREVIISRYGSGFPNQFNVIADPDGQFHYNSSGVGAGSGNITGQNFPDKTWHHHVWQYDAAVGTIHRWYINGAFANSADAGSSLAVSSATGFGIASRADDYERWDGKIAVVRIYNRALSATEIKNHFELDRGRFGV